MCERHSHVPRVSLRYACMDAYVHTKYACVCACMGAHMHEYMHMYVCVDMCQFGFIFALTCLVGLKWEQAARYVDIFCVPIHARVNSQQNCIQT